jgi:hypothetical protein
MMSKKAPTPIDLQLVSLENAFAKVFWFWKDYVTL